MKLSFKTILPIILISALLILLAGCFGVPADESPGFTPGTITGIIAAPCCSTSDDPVTETCCVSPEYWCYYCQGNWLLQDGIEVVLTYGEDEVATTTTNDKGEFTFTDVDPGKNYVVTAYCPDFADNRPLVKDVALQLVEGGSFDTNITDLVSTSLGLVVDFLVLYTDWGPEDISLDAVLVDRPEFPNFPKFKALIYEVRRVVENCELNLLTDDDVLYATCRAAEEISGLDIGCGPGETGGEGEGEGEGECEGNDAPVIDKVEYDDGTGFKEIAPNDVIHLIVGTPYEFCVTATDIDGILQALTYYLTIDGVDYPSSGNSNCLTITPEAEDVDNNPHEAFVNVYDGCDTNKWGPVTVVVDCCPFADPGPAIEIDITPPVSFNAVTQSITLSRNRELEPVPDITLCMEECVTINSVTIHYGGTHPLPDLVITPSYIGKGLTWVVDPGISFDPTTGAVCLTGGVAGTPGIYTISVTYKDLCDNSVSDSVYVKFEDCSCPDLETLSIAIDPVDGTVCDDECVTLGPVTISFTDATPDLDIIDLTDASLTWDTTPVGISFSTSTGEVCLTGNPNTYTLGVTYTDECEETVYGTVDVTFELCEYTLILNVNPVGGGIVTGAGVFGHGVSAPILATPEDGYQFTGWTVQLGDANNVGNTDSASTTVTMNENMSLTANFVADIFQGGTVSIAFEDLRMTTECDYDYNDWVVDLEMNTFYDGDTPNLSSITFDITPKARGAGHDHRFHILIPAGTFAEGSYNLVITGASGSGSGTFNSGSNMDFVVIPDTRASLNNEGHNHTNTLEGEGPTLPNVTASLTITFTTPFYYDFGQYDPYSAASMHGEGLFFDPYIEVDEAEPDKEFDYPDYEVHRLDPRILTVPDNWEWPEEGIAIWDVYSSVSEGNPPVFTPAWWEDSHNNCVYGDGIVCP